MKDFFVASLSFPAQPMISKIFAPKSLAENIGVFSLAKV
jgi:hypothetical protein